MVKAPEIPVTISPLAFHNFLVNSPPFPFEIIGSNVLLTRYIYLLLTIALYEAGPPPPPAAAINDLLVSVSFHKNEPPPPPPP